MKKIKQFKNNERGRVTSLFIALFVLVAIIFLLASCKSVKPTPIAHDTVYINNTEYVTQIKYDSIFTDRYHDVYIKGDTVTIRDSVVLKDYKIYHDTCKITDTCYRYVDKPFEVVKEKKVVPVWCWILLSINVLVVLAVLVVLYFNKKGKKFYVKHTYVQR